MNINREKIGEQDYFDGESILAETKISGHIDLRRLDADRLSLFKGWFLKNFSELSEIDNEELLEQFIQAGVSNEDELLPVVRELGSGTRAELANFISRLVDPVKYKKLFWETAEEMELDQFQKAVDRFTLHEPEKAILLAGLVDLSHRLVSKTVEGKKVHENLITAHYNSSYDVAEPLILALIERGGVNSGVLSQFNPWFLVPHIKKLEKAGIREVEIKKILNRTPSEYVMEEKNFSAEEREVYKGIRKQIFDRLKKRLGDSIDEKCFYVVNYSDSLTQGEYARFSKLMDSSVVRFCKETFRDFKNYKKYLDDPLDFLYKAMDESNMSPFLCIEDLGLDKSEVAYLLRRMGDSRYAQTYGLLEIKGILDFNNAHGEESPDLEEIIVKEFLRDIATEKEYLYFANRIARNDSEQFLKLFRHENRTKIIEAIQEFAPSLCLENVQGFANLGVDMGDILEKIPDYYLLKNYNKLTRVGRDESEPIEIDLKSLKLRVRRACVLEPEHLLNEELAGVIKDCLSEEDISEIIDKALMIPVSNNFFFKFINSDLSRNYLGRCKELVKHDLGLLIYASEISWAGKLLFRLFPAKELMHVLLRNLDVLDTDIFQRPEVYECVLKDERFLEHFLKRVENTGKYRIVVRMAKSIQWDIKDSKRKTGNDVLIFKNKLVRFLNNAAIRVSDLAFDKNVLALEGMNVNSIIRQNADEYFRNNPEILVEQDLIRIFIKVLGNEKYEYLLRKHFKMLVFGSVKYIGENIEKLPPGLRGIAYEINPCVGLKKKDKLERDYYETLNGVLSKGKYYEFFKGTLEGIAFKEKENFGEQLIPREVYVNDDYMQSANSLMLLQASELARDNYEKIVRLSKREQEQVIKILEFVSLFGLEDDCKGADFSDFEGSIKLCQEVVSGYLIHQFSLEKDQKFDFSKLDINSLIALTIYYKKRCAEDQNMDLACKEVVGYLVNGEYKEFRAWGRGLGVDLERRREFFADAKKKGLLPAKLKLEQYETWVSTEEYSCEQVLDYDSVSVNQAVRDILQLAVADRHVSEDFFNDSTENLKAKLNGIKEGLAYLVEKKKILLEKLQAGKGILEQNEVSILSQGISELNEKISVFKEENENEMRRLESMLYLEALRDLSLENISAQEIILPGTKKKIEISKAISYITKTFNEDYPDFAQDLRRVQQLINESRIAMFGENKVSKTSLRVTDSVDFRTHILIGEEPVPSCQNYNSKNRYSAGLLSYIIDPNVKIIQLYNEKGSIVARSIVRLLQDQEGNPALYMERVYSSNPHPGIEKIISGMVKLKAEKLGVDCFSEADVDDMAKVRDVRVKNLFSLGSRSPFVYTDAGGGLVARGMFRVPVYEKVK